MYRSRGRTDRLAALYEKRVGFAGTAADRIDMRRSLARVLEEEAKDPNAALRVLLQGLADEPSDSLLLEQIERLAPITGNWEGAALALRDAVDKKPDLMPDVARNLSVRVATWYRDRAGDRKSAEKSLEKALEFDPESDEVLTQIEQLQTGPGRERDLVQTLRRRAKFTLDDDARVALYRRAKELADSLGDRELAEAVLRELLSKDDTNQWALAELSLLRGAAGDDKELFSLLLRRVELGGSAEENHALRHKAAELARDRLNDSAKAIELYAGLFEDGPTDVAASRALRALYERGQSHTELARLLERLIDVATSPADRGTLRMELSTLRATRFGELDAAVELLRAVVEEEPARAEAVTALSALYERGERYEDLADLLAEQIATARSRGDTETELAFQVRLGEVRELRLSDKAKAIETYESILVRNPEHGGALQALVRLYQASGDHAAAARTLETLLGVSSGADAQRLAATLAEEYRALGDLGRAAAALERGLEVDPKNTPIRDALRTLYEETGTWDKLASLVAGDADIAESVDDKVKLFRRAASIQAGKRTDHAASAELLERATAIKPDDRELMLELCDAYSASGRGKAAIEVLEKIVASFGGNARRSLPRSIVGSRRRTFRTATRRARSKSSTRRFASSRGTSSC